MKTRFELHQAAKAASRAAQSVGTGLVEWQCQNWSAVKRTTAADQATHPHKESIRARTIRSGYRTDYRAHEWGLNHLLHRNTTTFYLCVYHDITLDQ
jgi:hypothetical protein